MATLLLATKLNIPHLRPELVSRPGLLTMLDEGLRRKLTLVAAPAGYGKSTLLGEWVHQIDSAIAWLSLEQDDNDLARFMLYFSAAIQKAVPEINQADWPVNLSPQMPPIEMILTPLLNDLSSLDAPLVVVLDDFHMIEAKPIYLVITFLLEHLPAHVHLVIATRADPRLPIAQLRAKGELVELREADLRFTDQEITKFLDNVLDASLSQEQIAKLASRTEGWIAGLQLAAISMRGRDDLNLFIEEFSGSHEYVVDYLTGEVLKNQPAETQTFLLETSILDRMCGPLCEAVTGQGNGNATLEKLRDAHLFVLPLDDERRWYRYHRLFADHLQKRLRRLYPEKVKFLYRAAGEWFEQAGMLSEAIDQVLQAGDFDRAADLIDQVAEEKMLKSEFALFLRWTEALPAPVLKLHPMVGVARAMSLLMTGNPIDEVEQLADGLVCDTDTQLGGRFVVQATIAVLRGQISVANQLAQRAIGVLSADENASLRDVAMWILNFTGSIESTPVEGLPALEKVIDQSRASGNKTLFATASIETAKLYTYLGQLGQARSTLEEALNQAREERGELLPIAGELLLALGELFREQNQLKKAELTLKKGFELTKRGRTATSYRGYISLAKVKLAQDQEVEAYHNFQVAKSLAFFEFDRLYAAVAEAQGHISQGDFQAAAKWWEDRGRHIDLKPQKNDDNSIEKHIRKYEMLLVARIMLAKNQLREATKCLETLLEEMQQQERLDMVIEIQILKTLVLQKGGKLVEALAALGIALSYARPGGYMRIFLDERQPMASLLGEASARGVEPEYTAQLLAAFSEDRLRGKDISEDLPPVAVLADPLSERELQVLRMLASPLSSTEIAGELYISVNTARFHIKNIYGKLGVHSRVDAVERARDLGLLT